MSPIQNPPPPAFDPAQAALAALARAGLRAAEDAQRANTHMVLAENGQVVHVSPQAYLRMRAEQEALQPAKDGTMVESNAYNRNDEQIG
jgi:hypothetical protein